MGDIKYNKSKDQIASDRKIQPLAFSQPRRFPSNMRHAFTSSCLFRNQ